MESQGSSPASPPPGRPTPSGDSPVSPTRFVILRHQRGPDIHWDLMLQVPGQSALATWQVPLPPESWSPAAPIPVTRLPDHRPLYLEYEGPISNHRGTVARVEQGQARLHHLDAQSARFDLEGTRLRAHVEIRSNEMIVR